MYKRVFDIHAWKLSTHAFNEGDIRLYESLTSIGNGYMGMRGNFEEGFSGDSHTGTYIAGKRISEVFWQSYQCSEFCRNRR